MLEDFGKLVLRLTVGGLMLPHGVAKVLKGIEPISEMLAARGLPEFVAYGVYVGEIVAPLLLLVGWLTRASAAVLAFNMVVAVGLAHAGDVFKLDQHGGWAIEIQAFYLLAAVAIALVGPGSLSVDHCCFRGTPTDASNAGDG